MRLRIDLLTEPVPNIRRLIEDLAATLPLFKDCGRRHLPIHPSLALLEQLGRAYLAEAPRVVYAGLPLLHGFRDIVDAWYFPILLGSTHLSYFLMAVCCGRSDLRERFVTGGRWDWTGSLRWLLLHGVRELGLWPFLSDGFIEAVRSPSVVLDIGTISPIEYCLIGERPELREQVSRQPHSAFREYLTDWFLSVGVSDYGLSWLFSEGEVNARADRNRHGADVAGLTRAHDGNDIPDNPPLPAAPSARIPTVGAFRRDTRGHYNPLLPGYPFLSTDLSDPAAIAGLFRRGTVRPALSAGVELISPEVVIQLPVSRCSAVLVVMDLAVPVELQSGLFIGFRIEDSLACVVPAAALTRAPITIPVNVRKPAAQLEISFMRPTGDYASTAEPLLPYALMRSFGIWQVRPSHIPEDPAPSQNKP